MKAPDFLLKRHNLVIGRFMNANKLRSSPLIVLYKDARDTFKLTPRWNPLSFMKNDYEDKGNTVVDHATGLQWQKSGSSLLPYDGVQAYIDDLNKNQFAGYDNWRLPTTEELVSLIEPEKQSNGLYLSTLFDQKQHMCWGADHHKGYLWNVYFDKKRVFYDNRVTHYVRAVREVFY